MWARAALLPLTGDMPHRSPRRQAPSSRRSWRRTRRRRPRRCGAWSRSRWSRWCRRDAAGAGFPPSSHSLLDPARPSVAPPCPSCPPPGGPSDACCPLCCTAGPAPAPHTASPCCKSQRAAPKWAGGRGGCGGRRRAGGRKAGAAAGAAAAARPARPLRLPTSPLIARGLPAGRGAAGRRAGAGQGQTPNGRLQARVAGACGPAAAPRGF